MLLTMATIASGGCKWHRKLLRDGEELDQEDKTILRCALCCEGCVVVAMVALVAGTTVALLYE